MNPLASTGHLVSLRFGVAVVGSVLLSMIVTWELVGAATGESPAKGMAIRMGGVPPRVRPSWREGFILV